MPYPIVLSRQPLQLLLGDHVNKLHVPQALFEENRKQSILEQLKMSIVAHVSITMATFITVMVEHNRDKSR
ncbi:unnamed protein product [Fusarium graminearum]|uniref:Chromosome 4, complete genome n=1 Tax=Gibberella zeae (strain ATCC MYA-4620 / CBS 123657 / FGSC 9075 / NRRL 31084 / PH-1) TaxID=229533 RepID=A0A098DSD0_GIBZE|nr:unnamed protein product [Fusarium graminearum]CZS72550.1 unnamed protein product [Fusarium graminearum]